MTAPAEGAREHVSNAPTPDVAPVEEMSNFVTLQSSENKCFVGIFATYWFADSAATILG
jgi:hypothetical protein